MIYLSKKIPCFLSLLVAAANASAWCNPNGRAPEENSCGPEGSICVQAEHWASQYGTGTDKLGSQAQGAAGIGWWDNGDWATYGPVDFGSTSNWIDEITFRFSTNGIHLKELGDQFVEIRVSSSLPSCPDEDWDNYGTLVATIEPELFPQGQMNLQSTDVEDMSVLTGEVYITLLCKKRAPEVHGSGFWNLDYFYIRPLSGLGGYCQSDYHCSNSENLCASETCVSDLGGPCDGSHHCTTGAYCHPGPSSCTAFLDSTMTCSELSSAGEYTITEDVVLTGDIHLQADDCFSDAFLFKVSDGVTVDCQGHAITASTTQARTPGFFLEGDATLQNCSMIGFEFAIRPNWSTNEDSSITVNILDSFFEDVEDVLAEDIAFASDTTFNLVGNHYKNVEHIASAYYYPEKTALTINVKDSFFDASTHGAAVVKLRDHYIKNESATCEPQILVFENNSVGPGGYGPIFEIEAGNCEFLVELLDGASAGWIDSDQTGTVNVQQIGL